MKWQTNDCYMLGLNITIYDVFMKIICRQHLTCSIPNTKKKKKKWKNSFNFNIVYVKLSSIFLIISCWMDVGILYCVWISLCAYILAWKHNVQLFYSMQLNFMQYYRYRIKFEYTLMHSVLGSFKNMVQKSAMQYSYKK